MRHLVPSLAKQVLPGRLKTFIKRGRWQVRRFQSVLTRVEHRSCLMNAYHCCVQKTASQWIRALLSDLRTYRYSGLISFDNAITYPKGYDPRILTDRTITLPFPKRAIVGPLYLDYQSYLTIPKPPSHKAFFVMRDPRDIVVSHYFSSKVSLGVMGDIPHLRKELQQVSVTEGLIHVVDYLRDYGLFAALDSWVDAQGPDADILLLPFEALTAGDHLQSIQRLFTFLDIQMPESVLQSLLEDYRFERLSGRKPGVEDQQSHYRKGVAGDWRSYFDATLAAHFIAVTGDLLHRLGYEEG